MFVKDYIVVPAVKYGILPYLEIFAIVSPLRKKVYGGGEKRRIYLPQSALRKLGLTPYKLCDLLPLPRFSPVKVSDFNQGARQYQARYGTASLKKAGREEGKSLLKEGFLRQLLPTHPLEAQRLLMNCISLFIGAKVCMERVEIGRYARCTCLERQFPFKLEDGKVGPGEKYFWAFLQGAMSTDLCHNRQMRAEVSRRGERIYVVSKSVEEWGDYLLDHIEEMF